MSGPTYLDHGQTRELVGKDRSGQEVWTRQHVYVRKGRYAGRSGIVRGWTAAQHPFALVRFFDARGQAGTDEDLIPAHFLEVTLDVE